MELKLAEQGALQHSAWHFELDTEQSDREVAAAHSAAAVAAAAAAAKARSSGSGGGSCVCGSGTTNQTHKGV